MFFEPTSMCRALVGLADIGVVGWTTPMQVHIVSTTPRPSCASYGTPARVKQTMRRPLVGLPSFGPAGGNRVASGPLALSRPHESDGVVDADDGGSWSATVG